MSLRQSSAAIVTITNPKVNPATVTKAALVKEKMLNCIKWIDEEFGEAIKSYNDITKIEGIIEKFKLEVSENERDLLDEMLAEDKQKQAEVQNEFLFSSPSDPAPEEKGKEVIALGDWDVNIKEIKDAYDKLNAMAAEEIFFYAKLIIMQNPPLVKILQLRKANELTDHDVIMNIKGFLIAMVYAQMNIIPDGDTPEQIKKTHKQKLKAKLSAFLLNEWGFTPDQGRRLIRYMNLVVDCVTSEPMQFILPTGEVGTMQVVEGTSQ
jgi:hypothetical protein